MMRRGFFRSSSIAARMREMCTSMCGRRPRASRPSADPSARRATAPGRRSRRASRAGRTGNRSASARRRRRAPRAHRGRSRGGRSAAASFDSAIRPPQYRFQTSKQLARLERLGKIVVGADLQPDDAIHLVAARCQHQHRQVPARAQPPADFEPVHVGQQRSSTRASYGSLPSRSSPPAPLAAVVTR